MVSLFYTIKGLIAYRLDKHDDVFLHLKTSLKTNDYMSKYVSDNVTKDLANRNIKIGEARILILGLTFKENVSDIRNSKMIEIYKNLESYGLNIFAYDPYVNATELLTEFNIKMHDINTISKKVDAIIYGVSHKIFKKINDKMLKRLLSDEGVIYDIQSNLDFKSLAKSGIKIWQL